MQILDLYLSEEQTFLFIGNLYNHIIDILYINIQYILYVDMSTTRPYSVWFEPVA